MAAFGFHWLREVCRTLSPGQHRSAVDVQIELAVNKASKNSKRCGDAGLLRLITSIRESHPDMEKLYTEGQCFNFAMILRGQYPGGKLWYSASPGHMYYYYEDAWYDIRGKHCRQPPHSSEYNFKDGDPAHRWGRRDTRRLVVTHSD